MVIGWEALETAVTDSSTGSPSLKAGGLMASVTAIEGGGKAGQLGEIGLYRDILWLEVWARPGVVSMLAHMYRLSDRVSAYWYFIVVYVCARRA